MEFDDLFDQQLENTGFLHISYLSSGVIVAAVFATSVLVGPILWFALRNRRRRRWMWGAAPVLSIGIAALLTTTGQGVLSDASTSAVGGGVSTHYSTTGEFGVGIEQGETETPLGADGQVWASGPRAYIVGSGEDRRSVQTLGSNGFGYTGLGVVPVDDGALVSVTATPRADDRIDVTVTNHSRAKLIDVTVTGFGRSRDFLDVVAGGSKTLAFEVNKELVAFGPLFPLSMNGQMNCVNGMCLTPDSGPFGRISSLPHASRGRIEIRGLLVGPIDVAGTNHPDSAMQVIARTAVAAPEGDARPDASLRIESVGVPPAAINQMFVGGGGAPIVIDDTGPVPTTEAAATESVSKLKATPRQDAPTTTAAAFTVGPDGQPVDAATSFGQVVAPQIDPVDVYAFVTSPVDRVAFRCAAHTVVNSIDEWQNGQWVTVPVVGQPAANPHFVQPNETRDFEFRPLAAGETRFIRLTTGLPVLAASALSCIGAA